MLYHSKRFVQSSGAARKLTTCLNNKPYFFNKRMGCNSPPFTTHKITQHPNHNLTTVNTTRHFSSTPPQQPHQPVPPPLPVPPPQIPTIPPPQPTPTPLLPKTTAADSLDGVKTNIKGRFLDRRDNIHSYEEGQFQVSTGKKLLEKNSNWLYYLTAMGFGSLGMSFVAVPLYQAFCQMTGSGGSIRRDQQIDELNRYMQRTNEFGDVTLRPIEVTFHATVDPNLDWEFLPCQRDITLRIGETALAFFRAKNNSDKPIIGVSTYNVLPPQAGLYFNKIQCFCFDEQRLRAGEEIDMPVFFFLDPAMADDWRMDNVDQVNLCYTFFQVQEDEIEDPDNAGLNSANLQQLLPKPQETRQATVQFKIITDTTEQQKAIEQMKQFDTKNNQNQSDQSLVCPIIPPNAMHNPSGIKLSDAGIPRQTDSN